MELFNIEVERQYLRVLADVSLTDPKHAYRLAQTNGVESAHLWHEANRDALAAIVELVGQDRPADVVSAWALLKDSAAVAKAGGGAWLTDLLLSTLESWEHALPGYAQTLKDLALRRRVRETCAALTAKVLDPDAPVQESLCAAAGELSRMTRGTAGLRTVQDSLMDVVLAELERKGEGAAKRVIPTGLPSLDSLIGGLQPTLIMVLAQAGVGKSAFLATIVQSIAAAGRKVGVFSLEDEGDWITWRLLACEARVNQFAMRYEALRPDQLERISGAGAKVHSYGGRIYVDDRPGLTPADVAQSAREMILVHGCEGIVLDHLGEMHLGHKRERFDLEIDEALRDLRDIAKTHHVPVVVACHTKRIDPGTPPKLSDAANSASIERKARIALGLSRAQDGAKLRIDVLKQTNGVAGKWIEIDFVKPYAVVRDDGSAAVMDAYADEGGGR